MFAFASPPSQTLGAPVAVPGGGDTGPVESGVRDRPQEAHSLQLQDRIYQTRHRDLMGILFCC